MSVAPIDRVGRRKELILGYVPKNDEKKNLVHKGLKYMKMIAMNESIVFLNIINKEGQLILKNEQYIKKYI